MKCYYIPKMITVIKNVNGENVDYNIDILHGEKFRSKRQYDAMSPVVFYTKIVFAFAHKIIMFQFHQNLAHFNRQRCC